MPELPELDVLAQNLAAKLGGARVDAVRVVSVAALKTFDPPIDTLVGQAVTGAGRRAKYVCWSSATCAWSCTCPWAAA